MARDFQFNQYLTVSYPVVTILPRAVTGPPLTLACWFNSDDLSSLGQVMVFLGNVGLTADGFWIGLNADATLSALTTSGNLSTYAQAVTAPAWSVGQWYHGCGVFESATSRIAYINGGNAGTNSTSVTPAAAITGISIGTAHTGSPFAFMDGRIAEAGLWDVALTPAEIASLARGISPLCVRPQNLRAYWPLIGRAAPDLELMQGLSVNIINSPGTAAHCRVVYPSAGVIPNHAALPGAVEPPLVSNPFQVFAPSVSAEGAIVAPLVSAPFQIFAPTITTDLGFAPPVISNPFTVYAPAVNVSESTIQEDSRELEPHNLKVRIVDFVAGDDLRITRLYTELQGGITITKGYLTIKRRAKDDTDAEAVIQKSITTSEQMSGKIVDNDTTGGTIQLYFDLSNADTALLTPLIPYHYDVQVITIGNAVYTCEKGVIVMQQGVTEASS